MAIFRNLWKAGQCVLLWILLFTSIPSIAQDYLISQGGIVETCGGTLYDSGGPFGNYLDGEFSQITLCSSDPSLCLQLNFVSYSFEDGFDILTIHAGENPFDPVIGSFSGTGGGLTFTAPGSCLTIVFSSDFVVNLSGFEAGISCVACPTCDDGIMNGLESGVDCGGSCEPCPCADIEIPSLPYDFAGSTCNMGNSFDSADLCNNWNIDANDVTFSFIAESTGCIYVEASGYPPGSAGMIVTSGCPDDFTASCMLNLTDQWTGTMGGSVMVEEGETYFITIGSASWMANCIDFNLNIDDDCPDLTSSDCLGAIPVCQEFYTEVDAPLGAGNFPMEIAPMGCNFVETNSIWYTFTVQEAGLLSFILDPVNNNDDYDWALYDISEFDCADIPNLQQMEVSCNSWGTFGINGSTGISTAMGGTGNSNGPGNGNGPPFNADLPVQEGQTFALVVMNWSNSLQGYTLDFGGSTASIFDEIPPEFESLEVGCSANQIEITFTEPVLCSTLLAENFVLTGPDGEVTVESIISGPCAMGAISSQSVTLVLSDVLTPGNYELAGESVSGEVTDGCGNPIELIGEFIASDLFTVTPVMVPACFPGTGSIDASGVQGGLAPFAFALDGAADADGVFDGLDAGLYEISITDAGGCELELELEVTGEPLLIDAGEDLTPCEMTAVLLAEGDNGTVLWTGPAEVNFSDPSSMQTMVSSEVPGTYLLHVEIQNGPCMAEDEVSVTLSEPISFQTVVNDAICYGVCDGSISISSNPENLQYSINGGNSFTPLNLFESLCAGTYNVVVRDEYGCSESASATITQPPLVIAGFDADPPTSMVPFTEIQFFNLSENYDSSMWYFGEGLGISFENDPTFTFPIEQGGSYPVSLVVFNENGCSDSLTRVIIIESDFQVFVPNSFTPNNDGMNDYFLPQFTADPLIYEIRIFNRWGETVFDSEDPLEAWTGNFEGGDYFVEPGVYVWMMRAGRNAVEVADYRGHVTVVR